MNANMIKDSDNGDFFYHLQYLKTLIFQNADPLEVNQPNLNLVSCLTIVMGLARVIQKVAMNPLVPLLRRVLKNLQRFYNTHSKVFP